MVGGGVEVGGEENKVDGRDVVDVVVVDDVVVDVVDDVDDVDDVELEDDADGEIK